VLDEGDRMLDMGFLPDIKRILALLPAKRQNLLFSATFSDDIKKLANHLLNKPVLIEVGRGNAPADMVAHVVHPVDHNRKRELLSRIIKSQDLRQVLVFTRTKHGANRLAHQLQRDGIHTTAIHSNKSQPARIQALADFKSGKVRVLVATDIAARGLDIDELPHVINFELPHVAGDYVHRIGRTGRAGSSGDAISLVCAEEMEQLKDIERFLKFGLPVKVVPGFEPNQKAVHRESRRPGRAQPHVFKREHSNIAPIASTSKPPASHQALAQKPQQPHVKKSMPALFLPPAKAKHNV
ncbi:MAG: DEAD/DEAH box helicase, partial [Burkholderiales bacterium]